MEAVEKKLKALQKLQKIDSKIDAILKVRGDLPEEVQDLEDELEGYNTRLKKYTDQVSDFETSISDSKTGIKNAEALIVKYEEQQNKVRNNREYDAITKEVELQKLEIQILEKRIKESGFHIEKKSEEVEKLKEQIAGRETDLAAKKEELTTIIAESEEDEKKLIADREKAGKSLEDRLLLSYEKLRKNARNGLAVVSVKREACGGCFNTVPAQRQADIRDRKKIIVCEHCGRILAEADLVIEEEKPKKTRTRKKAAEAK